MSIELSDTQLRGARSQDLKPQLKIDEETLFAVHKDLSSCRSSYGAVSSDAKISALAMMRVGSMAFKESWEYSPLAHSHGNYTNVSADARYGYSGDGSTVKIGTLSAGDACVEGFRPGQYKVVDIYCPTAQCPVPREPAYGTLRFMYRAPSINVTSAYIASDDFDGWVFPNGESYAVTPSQFTKAGNPFVTYDSNPFVAGGILRVPNLSGRFFSLNPFTRTEAAGDGAQKCRFAAVASHNAVPSHTHSISSLSANVVLSADISAAETVFNTATGCSKFEPDRIHHGKGDVVGYFEYTAIANFNSVQINLQTRDCSQSPINNYPNHWAMPVMIYVGGRRKEYEKTYLA